MLEQSFDNLNISLIPRPREPPKFVMNSHRYGNLMDFPVSEEKEEALMDHI